MEKNYLFTGHNYDLYTPEAGCGYLKQTSSMPVRTLYPELIVQGEKGAVMPPCPEHACCRNANACDNIGMAFRIDLPPGAYHIEVTVLSRPEQALISVSGMNAEQIALKTFWDAAMLIPRIHTAGFTGNVWSYDYINPRDYIEVEIEPAAPEWEVSVASIRVSSLPARTSTSCIPTIFTLGDSTVKSYIYEENLMSGWGQIFDDFFDRDKVSVLNYAMGGRSLSSMYREGRMNDLLLNSRPGDILLLQSGHNDEARGELDGPEARFGRGNTEATFQKWLDEYFIPAAALMDIRLILVSPMTRINGDATGADGIVYGGFTKSNSIDCPGLLKAAAAKHGLPFIDLYQESIQYLEDVGGEAAKALFLSVEAGETPGKTNSGSYANGHPDNKCDGTHYKEALAKQFARIVAREALHRNLIPENYFRQDVLKALKTDDSCLLFPELSEDVQTGRNAYYRNQIEFLLKYGIMGRQADGCFHPAAPITVGEFQISLAKALHLSAFPGYDDLNDTARHLSPDLPHSLLREDSLLTRECMSWLVFRAFLAAFPPRTLDSGEISYQKPAYMTDYNGCGITPDDPDYDPNLTGESAMYYPLVPWEQLTDTASVSDTFSAAARECYRLGLIRSETGIRRGRMCNGTLFQPRCTVTREKAAKELYFLQALVHEIHEENDRYDTVRTAL